MLKTTRLVVVLSVATATLTLHGQRKPFTVIEATIPEMRAALEQPETHLAVLDFLLAHEPDLIAAGESTGIAPAGFVAAQERLAR